MSVCVRVRCCVRCGGSYPSDYMTHGDGCPMQAFPMRAGCANLADPSLAGDDQALMEGLREFVAVYYNRTSIDARCFNVNQQALAEGGGGGATTDASSAVLLRQRRPPLGPLKRRPRGDGARQECQGDWDYQYCACPLPSQGKARG